MGSQSVPPRRIIPPAPPANPQTPTGYHYTPVKIPKQRRSMLQMVLLWSGIVVILVLGAIGFRIWMTPPELAIHNALVDRAGALAAEAETAKLAAAKDVMRGGWVGTLELPLARANVTINSLPEDGIAAKDLTNDFKVPLSPAVVSVDNSTGTDDVIVDTTEVTLQFSDGRSMPSVKPDEVLMSATRDRNGAILALKPPYRCPRGQRLGKPLFLTHGIDMHELIGVTLVINGEKRQVPGSFMDETKKAAMVRDQGYRAGDLNAPASEPVAIPASSR